MDNLVDHFKQYLGTTFSKEVDSTIVDQIKKLNRSEREELRSKLFHEARILENEHNGGQAIFWLEFCLAQLEKYTFRFHKVYFSPGTDIREIISSLIDEAKTSINLCIFTITDSSLADRILRAHKRGVKIQIISDDRKTFDKGSDIYPLHLAGIPIKIDHSQYHMHHKFGIIDQRICFTGSFNWTYTATKHNQENLLVTSKYDLVIQYEEEFEKLWKQFYKL
ncbi:phospholipase D-like domain-containing protein [Sunxiuqinia sp. A32]|uniref:phospholipase D-like domain-containing protein n=1 Tax=Sunxiuqinia sp. A32 TaxID=3461496 RepID=UPI0040455627